jgi:HSP20 family protein
MIVRSFDPFRAARPTVRSAAQSGTAGSAVPIDVTRTDESIVVSFDLPGVSADSVDVSVDNRVLTVSASRDTDAPDGADFVRRERRTGSLSRQLVLAETLDSDNMSADLVDGVLRLEIPVSEKAKPHKVPVTVGSGAPELDPAEQDPTSN